MTESESMDCTGEGKETLPEHSTELNPEESKPFIAQENFSAFEKVVSEFSIAEKRMKMVEWIEGTDIPSINELRYVSYHLFKACQYQNNQEKQLEELRRAERHCKRASFDAMELGIISQLEKAEQFKNDYKDIQIADIISDYVALSLEITETQKFLQNSTIGEDRDEYYDDCEKKLLELQEINRKLNVAREELNKKQSQYYSDRKRLNNAERTAKYNLLAAIFAGLIALISIAIQLNTGLNHNTQEPSAETDSNSIIEEKTN